VCTYQLQVTITGAEIVAVMGQRIVDNWFWCGNVGVRNFLKDMCRWKDNIKMNLQKIALGTGLDTSGREQGQGAGCLNSLMYFGYIKHGQFFD
jgi:hypothetical protein